MARHADTWCVANSTSPTVTGARGGVMRQHPGTQPARDAHHLCMAAMQRPRRPPGRTNCGP
jgi:hypothetical protein